MEEKRTLAEVRAEAEAQITAWNTAYFEKKFDAMAAAESKLDEMEKEYIIIAQTELFTELASTEKPMLEAIKRLSYTVIGHKDKKDNDSGIITREIVDKDRQIDLLRLDEFCAKQGKTIAADSKWSHIIQQFNLLMALRAAVDLKLDPKAVSDSYFMSEKAREINLGKTPTSNTQLLKQLQTCVDAIIYEDGEHGNIYKAKSQDVAFLLLIYTKKGKKALSVATAKHAYMRKIITEVCHCIVTGKSYSLEYQEEKKN